MRTHTSSVRMHDETYARIHAQNPKTQQHRTKTKENKKLTSYHAYKTNTKLV